MKLVVAVSGGVDSVVLLDMLATKKLAIPQNEGVKVEPSHGELAEDTRRQQSPPLGLVVAHFDHGIRDDSHLDAQLVEELAEKYGLPFEVRREKLGADASENLARDRRYVFLRSVAKKHNAAIATAHHMNDIAETIAINLTRGTGWRGVAVLASDVYRPLLGMTKQEIIQYAKANDLEWREDSTNESDAYLRNRLRRKLTDEDAIRQLATLQARQVEIRDEIDGLIKLQLDLVQGVYSRYFFTHIDQKVAIEMLRAVAIKELGHSLIRPQLERSLLAIKTARAGSRFPFGTAELVIDKKTFGLSVKTP